MCMQCKNMAGDLVGGKSAPLPGSGSTGANPLRLLGSQLPCCSSSGATPLRLPRSQLPYDLKILGEEPARGVHQRFMHSKASINGSPDIV